ncbi:MAG: hypothetical protein KDD92_00765 [Caldilineaceae bacterium]|nr:hypothetical protein [Caldilineaceae bacterium]
MKKQLLVRFSLPVQSRVPNVPHFTAHGGPVQSIRRLLLFGIGVLLTLLPAGPALAAPEMQAPGNQAFFALSPLEGTRGELQTHTADITVAWTDGVLTAAVDALYRVYNGGADPITLLVRVEPQSDAAQADPGAVTLLADGVPVALEAGDGATLIGRVALPADGRSDLRLRYAVALGDGPTAAVGYDIEHLRAWTGERSLRVALALPALITPSSWIEITPAGWSDLTDSENGIKWLYDGVLPAEPPTLAFIHPAIWAQLQAAAAADSPEGQRTLGDLYRTLYVATAGDSAARFYAQSLAAYTAGAEAAGAGPAAAPFQAGIAALYRTRVVGDDGQSAPGYVQLMTEAARAAAAGFAPDDPRRGEMLRWEQEGLQLQLIQSRELGDWIGALSLIEQLTALPPAAVDQAALTQERREIEVQQALQLLEQGDDRAALALVGEEIADAQLAPTLAAQSLFAAWHVTMTVSTGATELLFVAQPAGDGSAGHAALAEQVARLSDAGLPRGVKVDLSPRQEASGTNPIRLALTIPADQSIDPLATLVSGDPQWAMLRSVLAQATPVREQANRFLWREDLLRQTLNLAPAADQWAAAAANLQRTAVEMEAAPSAGEEALRARIAVINYRNAAALWENLASNSWVITTLRMPGGADTLSRTWLTTADAPAQIMEYSAQTLNRQRLLIVALLGAIGLLLFSLLLWRLL